MNFLKFLIVTTLICLCHKHVAHEAEKTDLLKGLTSTKAIHSLGLDDPLHESADPKQEEIVLQDAPIFILPDEIFLDIFQKACDTYLHSSMYTTTQETGKTFKTFMSISKTCRRFYRIMNTLISSNHPKLQAPLVFISPKLGIPHKPFPTLLAPGPGIKLKAKRPKKKSLSIFLEMVRRRALPFGRCANLCVDQIVQNSPDPLLPYLENWPTGLLLSLKLESEITPIDFMSFLSHPAFHQPQAILRSLKIRGSGHFSDPPQEKSPIDTICSSSACRELKELYIEEAGVHTKDMHLGRKIAESPYMVNLEALFFSSCAVTVEDFEALSSTNSSVKKLKKLSIYNKGNILSEEDTTRIFELIADSENFAHLTEMTVIGTGNITNAAIYALCVSKHIKNLHYFYMMNQSRLSKEIIIPIATSVNFENAKELNFFLEKGSPDFSVEERKIMSEHPVFQKINFSMSW